MNADLESKIAALWWRILRTNPGTLFGSEAEKLLNRNWGDRIPQPGYVGGAYVENGLVFVSMNPGGMGADGLGPTDQVQLTALRKLMECAEEDIPRVFPDTMGVLERIMPTWRIFRNFVQPILNCGHRDLNQIAYLNLLKWRTKASSGLRPLYGMSWQDHTHQQFELLRPSIVVAIGVDASKAFTRLHIGKALVRTVPRVIGNNIGPPGRRAIESICRELLSTPGTD